ncbi:MAG: PilZ domain-containing protein [Gammaproteobacteria bacterium]
MTNKMASWVKRAYRKRLTSNGLIYLGFQEYQIQVINLSLTGLLAQFKANASVKDIFQNLQVSPLLDLYLPDIRVAGEAEVVRAEESGQGLQVAIEFRNLSYDVDNLLYYRRAYRKNLNELGQITIDGIIHDFNTENVSVDGIMAYVYDKIDVKVGAVVHIDFKRLKLSGDCEVKWVEPGSQSVLLGLKYLRLERDALPGVPNFVRHEKN